MARYATSTRSAPLVPAIITPTGRSQTRSVNAPTKSPPMMRSRQGDVLVFVETSIAGGPMASAEEIRGAQRARWAELSTSWDKWDSLIMDQLRPVGAAMIDRLEIAADQQHLDIAAGTG